MSGFNLEQNPFAEFIASDDDDDDDYDDNAIEEDDAAFAEPDPDAVLGSGVGESFILSSSSLGLLL